MTDFSWFLLAISTAFALAAAAGPLIWPAGRYARLTAICVVPCLMACPLLIPRDQIALRAIAALFAGELVFKILDFLRHVRTAGQPATAADYGYFLIPFPQMLVVFSKKTRYRPRDTPRWGHVVEIVVAALCLATVFPVLQAVSRTELVRSSFAVDHAIKLVLFIVVLESLSRLYYRLERTLGFDTRPPMQFFFLSRTVAEFWRRYNNRVHTWFHYNIFRGKRARQAPMRAVVLAFFISGLLHEVMFAVATSRVDGYQMTFFMLQVPAVIASIPLARLADRAGITVKALVRGLAIFWMATTSIFFFHGVNRVFPFFYASQPWLP